MGFHICGSPIIIPCHNWKTLAQTHRGREMERQGTPLMSAWYTVLKQHRRLHVGQGDWACRYVEKAIYHLFISDERNVLYFFMLRQFKSDTYSIIFFMPLTCQSGYRTTSKITYFNWNLSYPTRPVHLTRSARYPFASVSDVISLPWLTTGLLVSLAKC